MNILIDVDRLEREGVVTSELAAALRKSATRETGSAAINVLLAFGAAAVAGGLCVLFPSPPLASAIGLGFVAAGFALERSFASQWGLLGRAWMIIGALTLAGIIGFWLDKPMEGALAAAAILTAVAVLVQSHLLIALAPFALGAALGGSTGYWSGCYEIAIQEPTLTIIAFTLLGVIAWSLALRGPPLIAGLSLTFTRMCVILVNFGFWVGSLFGDSPGALWRTSGGAAARHDIPAYAFAIAWAIALLIALYWGARNGRRFLVNVAATFAGIHFYTQWFERLGATPLTVIAGGAVAILLGIGFWRYNQSALARPAT
jgi:iron complex transport system permease protein